MNLNSSDHGWIYRALLIPIIGGCSLLIARLIRQSIQQTISSTVGASTQPLMFWIIGTLFGVVLFCGGVFLHKRIAPDLKNRGADYASVIDFLSVILVGVGTTLVLFTVLG
jgi:hypothetical protein